MPVSTATRRVSTQAPRRYERTGVDLSKTRKLIQVTHRPGNRTRKPTVDQPTSKNLVTQIPEKNGSETGTYVMAAIFFGAIVIIGKRLKKKKVK